MNAVDLTRLEEFNERYGATNLTGFRFVNETTDKKTVLNHIELDLKILNSSEVEFKHVYRIILKYDCIDICTVDNGTIVSYFFLDNAKFKPKSIEKEIRKLCREFDIHFDEWI